MPVALRRAVPLLVVLALLCPAGFVPAPTAFARPRADDASSEASAHLRRGRALYEKLEYRKALDELAPIPRNPAATREQRVQALELLGLCALILGNEDRARGYFDQLLTLDPDHVLREESGSPKIRDFYRKVKRRHRGGEGDQPAEAGPLELTPSAAAARQYEAGLEAYSSGDHRTAISEWEAGLAGTDDPIFLVGLGNAHRLQGQCEKAIGYYRKFMETAVEESVQAEIGKLISECEQTLARQGGARAGAESEPRGGRHPGRGWKLTGAATGCVGLALAGTGLYFALEAAGIESEIETAVTNHDPWTEELENRHDQGARTATLSRIMFGAGAAAVVTGVVLYVHGARAAAAPPRTTLAPSLDGRSVGLVVAGTF